MCKMRQENGGLDYSGVVPAPVRVQLHLGRGLTRPLVYTLSGFGLGCWLVRSLLDIAWMQSSLYHIASQALSNAL